uniref:Exocyst complex component n=2 Tax=Parascaris univalens TaxID=6257 RepID=A0A915BPH7_PARUN
DFPLDDGDPLFPVSAVLRSTIVRILKVLDFMDGMSTTSISKETATGSSDTASTSYQQYPELTAEQEFFLYELETTDSGSIGLVLRAIYDCGDVHKFSRALEHRIHHYDRNIQKICSYHYQGHIDSMKQLLQLKSRCLEIKEDVVCIDNAVQESSRQLQKRSAEIVRYRKLQKNANTAIEHISICLPVLEHYARLNELMQQKKYYQALKVLEELEHTYLVHVDKYRFTQSLQKSMAPIREQIKEKSFSEFTDFLENIRKVSGRIGQHASKCTAEQHSFGMSEAERNKRIQDEAKRNAQNIQIELSSDGSIVMKNEWKVERKVRQASVHDDDELLSAQDLIDFTPVHRCCQIFNVLGAKEVFDAYYRKQRKEQAAVVIRPPSKLQQSIHSYVRYLDEIIGFFVVEDHIMQTEPSLVTAAYKDQLWEMALQQVTTAMNTHFGGCLDVEMMLRMKKVILLFALTMKSYGFGIGSLYTLLQNFRDQYNEILMREYCAQFERDLDNDNYAPIVANDEQQFKAIISQFPFYKRGLDQEQFPRIFPFSKFVPAVYGQAKSYLVGCLKFMEHLQLSPSEVDDTVRRYANVLLARWSGSLKSFVASKRRTLVQLVQITINIGYLEKSCGSLEQYISKLTNRNDGSAASSGHLLTLKDQVFRDARSEVEQQIDDALRDKVDAFLELANYDWELSSSSGRASDYISDLIKFLETTFLSFTNLPAVLARHVCMQICKYLANRLSDLLLSPDLKAVSTGALDQFDLDVIQCELFTSQCPVAGLEDATLAMTFASLRQLLDLVMKADWPTYLADYGKEESKYSRVKASSAIAVLEKMIEFERKSSSFFAKGREKDRKKLLDTIVRQLKALANQ